MHSFHDIHDFDDAGRTSHFDNSNLNSFNAPSSRAATLLLPLELKYNSILSLSSSSVDPSALRAAPHLDEVGQFSAFLPVARIPLILADTGRQLGGSSDFQINAALPLDTVGRINDAHSRKANGLGLHLSEDMNDFKPRAAMQPPDRSRTLSSDGLFGDFPDFSSECFAAQNLFEDDYGSLRSASSGLEQSNILADEKLIIAADSRISPSTSRSLDGFDHSFAASSSSQRLLGTSNSSKDSSDFTGLVADINMFDKEDNGNICVRPRDLMEEKEGDTAEEPTSPMSIKVEDTLDDPMLLPSNPTTPKYLNVPQPDWPQIPTEHLPFIIEQYLAQFAPSTEVATTFVPGAQPKEAPGHPYTPITAEILEAVEEPRPISEPIKQRKGLADKTNGPRTNATSRTGANIMVMHESLIPQDVALERAHEGVPTVIVVQKTRYFLMVHPGERLPEELLFSFAGRLNPSGQQIPGYRCYVEGCTKTTKRKDHMADHVRTHLGEKPFQCSVCGMGFIRNNDCQRHENNHRPDKKFVCPCKAAFSRRDLFVRHQKTVCTMGQGVEISGCIRRPRKCGKDSSTTFKGTRQGTPDGDDANDPDYIPGNITWTAVHP
ncbi:hypothetical protein ACEPAH_5858 [Sanghuangporus vaninii]